MKSVADIPAVQRRTSKAIRKGILVRPDSCESCGAKPNRGKDGRATIQAHHHKGYEPEHELDIQWLCMSCHKKVHGMTEEGRASASGKHSGYVHSEESRKKMSESRKGRSSWTPERREQQRIRMLEKWSSPKARAEQSERCSKDMPWLGRIK